MSKSLEDYLLTHEDRLLNQLNDVFINQNKNFFIVYILTAIFILFESGLIGTISIFGIEIKLNFDQFRLFIPYLFLFVYVFINFQIIKTSKLIKAIRLNGNEILKVNYCAMPLKIEDIFFYSKGLNGVVLLFARWQFSILVNKISLARLSKAVKSGSLKLFFWKAFLFLIHTLWWAIIFLVSFLLISILFVIPLLVSFFRIFSWIHTTQLEYLPIISLIVIGLSIIATISSITILFSAFLRELRENLNKKLDNQIDDLGEIIYEIFMNFIKKIGFILKD